MFLPGGSARARQWLACATVAVAWCTGCSWPLDGSDTTSDGSGDNEQVLSSPAERPPVADELSDIEPNNEFAAAQAVSLNETITISGTIAGGVSPPDRDVYDLGPISPQDRVLADLTISNNSDVVLGLLDEKMRVLGHIDQSSIAAGPRQADLVVRDAGNHLYVVVGTRTMSSLARPYTATVTVQRGTGVASVRPQLLVLNFSGGSDVRIGMRAAVEVPPFDAFAISPAFGGQTEDMIASILAKVRTDFEGLGVAVYRDNDADLPAGDHSTVYFGTYDSRLLGLADNVDPYNSQPVQSAILFTDTFAVFNALSPTAEQMAQTLANTTSHEAGHLLGLRHTAEPSDLMDTTASARQMMLDQDFLLADLNSSVLPLGFQDAPAMLSWTVGGELLVPPAAKVISRQRAAVVAGAPDDFYIPREYLMGCSCTDCRAD